jgi:hypothetical protein
MPFYPKGEIGSMPVARFIFLVSSELIVTNMEDLAERILWLESQLQAANDEPNCPDRTDQAQHASEHRLNAIACELRRILDEL